MQFWPTFLIVVSLFLSTFVGEKPTKLFPARSYVLMDALTLQVIESKQMDVQQSVASISKIMTAVVAIESAQLDDVVTVSKEILPAYGSSIYLVLGEQLTLKELVYGLLLRSGNDAALAIATYVSGDVSQFVQAMNEKAQKIGMHHSLFRNPHGLDEIDGGNLSTAYDMARLMAYALTLPEFRQISGATSYRSKDHGVWTNKNRLLSAYDLATGGKTGYTRKARRTLVTSARHRFSESIVVTLDCGSDFKFHQQKHEAYFATYETRLLLSREETFLDGYELFPTGSIYHTLPKEIWKGATVIYVLYPKQHILMISVVLANGTTQDIAQVAIEKANEETITKSWWTHFTHWLKEVFT